VHGTVLGVPVLYVMICDNTHAFEQCDEVEARTVSSVHAFSCGDVVKMDDITEQPRSRSNRWGILSGRYHHRLPWCYDE
jgi:hypothetical protein